MAITFGPRLGLVVNANDGEAWGNELRRFLRAFDALAVTPTVIDHLTASPPGSPDDGDCYIVPVGASGDWDTHTNKIARWSALLGAWEFYSPTQGWIAWSDGMGGHLKYTIAGGWSELATGGSEPPFEWPPNFLPTWAAAFGSSALSESDLLITSTTGSPYTVGFGVGRTSQNFDVEGKAYVEFEVVAAPSGTGNIAIGLITSNAVATLQNEAALTDYGSIWPYTLVGTSIALKGSGDMYQDNSGLGVYYGFSVGQRVGIAIDAFEGKVWFTINGVPSAGEDPTTGVGGFSVGMIEELHLFLGMTDSGNSVRLHANEWAQMYTPSGFSAWAVNPPP